MVDSLVRKHPPLANAVSLTILQRGLSTQLTVHSLSEVLSLGTTNFVHRIPYVAISIGFTLFTRPTVGVILNPFMAQLYTGIHARGSFLTTLSPDLSESISVARLPLYPPSTLELRSSIIAIEYGSERVGPNFECKLNTFKNLTSLDHGMVHSLHAYGCASLNVCMMASGYLDAYWDSEPWEWDFCAGCVILEEAGGSLVDGNPREGPDSMELPDLCGRVYLAVRQGRSADEKTKWVKEFWSLMEGRLKFER